MLYRPAVALLRALRTDLAPFVPALAVVGLGIPGSVEAAPPGGDTVDITGDFRFRLEADWDSRTSDGSERDDRNRARVRARVALSFKPSDGYSFGLRLRTSGGGSAQSPHYTILDFDDNDTGAVDFRFDKWYLALRHGRTSGWVGRNGLPFWKQNELFWDDDVTPAGVGATVETDLADAGELSLKLGYLALPAGIEAFTGRLAGAQAVLALSGEPQVTLAGGFFHIDADPDDPDAGTLLSGNGMRDYGTWVGNAQVKLSVPGGRPLVLGVDYLHNAEDYALDDPDPFVAANRDEVDGLVLSAVLGGLKKKGQWLAGWYYARIEALALNASYAQDDWVRWGSATETRSSDLEGHELRLAHAFSGTVNTVARVYLVESVTTAEDGKRARIDLNFAF